MAFPLPFAAMVTGRPFPRNNLVFLSARVAGGEARRGGSCFEVEDPNDLSVDSIGILERFTRRNA